MPSMKQIDLFKSLLYPIGPYVFHPQLPLKNNTQKYKYELLKNAIIINYLKPYNCVIDHKEIRPDR